MAELPGVLEYGRVVGQFLLAIADGEDEDELPDAQAPNDLRITFTPYQASVRLVGTAPVLISKQAIECRVDTEGHLISPRGYRGVRLITGAYAVRYKSSMISVAPHDITLKSTHTTLSPLDLNEDRESEGTPLTPSQYVELLNLISTVSGGGGVATWGSIADKPLQFPPTNHTHSPAQLGTGTANSTTVLYGDGTWKAAPTGGGGSGSTTTWASIDKPAFVAAGSTAADARAAIGAGTGNGTSNLAIGTTSTTAAAGNHGHAGMVTGTGITSIVSITAAAYGALPSPRPSNVLYVVVG